MLPEQRIVNDDILEMVAYYSRRTYSGDLRSLLSLIDAKLRRIGVESRYWRSSKERPFALLEHACDVALKQSKIARSEVAFVIYVGVDRGFAEPANACFVAKHLGINRAKTFDVVDACLGWSTAAEIAQALFATARGAVALIVSAEFPMRPQGSVVPECFTIAGEAELDWKFPAFTLGEAASASVLVGEGPDWQYVHESHAEFADLCTVNLGPPSDYAEPSPRFGSSASRGFRAYGNDLGRRIYRPAINVLRQLVEKIGTPRVVFPHSVVGPYIDQVVERVSTDIKVFSTFSDTGNLATSSLPTSISIARQRSIIGATDVVIGWAAASGLKVSAFSILQNLG